MWSTGLVWGATFEPTTGEKTGQLASWRQKMRAMSASSAPLHFYVCLHVQVPAICHCLKLKNKNSISEKSRKDALLHV